MEKGLPRRLAAELIGTFWLVLGGTGAAVFAATVDHGIGFLGVAFAFGLTVVTMAYSLGRVSGGHFNPAITLGLWTGKRFPGRDVLPYFVAQVVGAILASACVWLIAAGVAGFDVHQGMLAANGFGAHSPDGYNLLSCFVAELLLTAAFLIVILGVTAARAPKGFAPLAIGLTLTLIHLISIPITNTSVNPARSTGPALLAGGWALAQLWLFWLAPLLGGAIAGLVYHFLTEETEEEEFKESAAEAVESFTTGQPATQMEPRTE